MKRKVFVALATCAFVFSAGLASAGLTDEQKCLSGRAKAVGKFDQCVQNALAKGYAAGTVDPDAIESCVDKLDATWDKLSGLAASATCGGLARLQDNGTTFTDRLTGLVWEKKTSADSSPNIADSTDVDNGYNNDFAGTENGDLFTTFLDGLDSLDGSKSWRIPSMTELLTIVKQTIPGETQTARYWTTTANPLDSGAAWTVRRDNFVGYIESQPRWSAQYARAVRTGF